MVSIQTPLGQLFKLPLLIEHYLKHQSKDGDSFAEFMYEHYKSSHDDDDSAEDQQLPFKNITFHSIGHAIAPDLNATNVVIPFTADAKVIVPDNFVQQQYLINVFRPPRA